MRINKEQFNILLDNLDCILSRTRPIGDSTDRKTLHGAIHDIYKMMHWPDGTPRLEGLEENARIRYLTQQEGMDKLMQSQAAFEKEFYHQMEMLSLLMVGVERKVEGLAAGGLHHKHGGHCSYCEEIKNEAYAEGMRFDKEAKELYQQFVQNQEQEKKWQHEKKARQKRGNKNKR